MNRRCCIESSTILKSLDKKQKVKLYKKPKDKFILVNSNSKKVIIAKDGKQNKVIFKGTGKVWHCMNCEMILNATAMEQRPTLRFRSNLNCYDDPYRELVFKEYTDQELTLLFLIDPLGVANYIARYGGYLFSKSGLAGTLDCKEHMFKVLFERKPRYFYNIEKDIWVEAESIDDRRKFISEAEIFFGIHLNDSVHPDNAYNSIIEIIKTAYGDTILGDYPNNLYITNIIRAAIYEIVTGIKVLKNDTLIPEPREFTLDSLIGTNIAWSEHWVLNFNCAKCIAKDSIKKLNFYVELLDFIVNKSGYDVAIRTANSNTISLEKIKNEIKRIEDI